MTRLSHTIKLRRDTAARWSAANSVLAGGEPGFETDTGKLKIGDGAKRWLDLEYFLPGSTEEIIAVINEHIENLQAYDVSDAAIQAAVIAQVRELQVAVTDDDGPSLFLLYENAKV